MKIAGIICEFNPFHEGHKYLIDSVRQDLDPDAVVCVMSGNYVQRGMPAFWNKWERAKAAIIGGADLVLQMPVCVSLSSAAYFAAGAVDIIKGVNCNYLCFGSECGDLNMIKHLSENGIDGPEEGNNILGAEYLRQLDDDIIPWTIKINTALGHAEDIRNKQNNNYVNKAFELLRYKIIQSEAEDLALCPEVSEGLENRIKKAVSASESMDSLIKSIKSKRYTYTRISRCMMQILLDIHSSTPAVPYAHVLAFNETGQKIIKNSNIKLYSNIDPEDCRMSRDLKTDVEADDIYSVITSNSIYYGSDYVCKPWRCNI